MVKNIEISLVKFDFYSGLFYNKLRYLYEEEKYRFKTKRQF